MTPGELFNQGMLGEAVTAALQDVRQHPADFSRRWLLAELLCVTGDVERADKQLDALNPPDPPRALAVSEFRQLVRAEIARQQVFQEGRLPEFIEPPTESLQLHLQALIALREGKPGEAEQLLVQMEQVRPRVRGRCNGTAFADFSDTDSLTASFFEVHSPGGRYYWIPCAIVERIDFRAPQRPRDLLWHPVHMKVRGSSGSELFLPVVYVTTYSQGDDLARMARATSWQGGAGSPVVGIGQRVFQAGEADLSLLEMQVFESDEAVEAVEAVEAEPQPDSA